MRHFGIALILVISLAACNMTMEKPATEPLNNETVALSPQQPSTVQSSAVQQFQTSEQAESEPVTQSSASQNAAPQSAAPQSAAPQKPAVQSAAPQNAVVLPPCSIRTDWQLYTVVSGDTLSQIAQRSGTDLNTLSTANCLKDANAISVGQALRVPSMPVSMPAPGTGGSSTSGTAHLRMVGDFAGRPLLEACWASNPGTNPLVYDRIDGTAFAYLSNRLLVVSATPTWVQVEVQGTMTIPDTTGWMRVSDVNLIGFCTEVTGVELKSFRGDYFGRPEGVPNGFCAVATNSVGEIYNPQDVPVYDSQPNGWVIGEMGGYAKWVSTAGNFYQVEVTAWTGHQQTILAWVSASVTHLVNC